MAKTIVSADYLVFRIEMELRGKDRKKVPAPSVAIVPDRVDNWIAVTSARDRLKHPGLIKKIDQIQIKLRTLYGLQPE